MRILKRRGKVFWAIGLLVVGIRLFVRLDKYAWEEAPWKQPPSSETKKLEELELPSELFAKPELEEVQKFLGKLEKIERRNMPEESEGRTGFESPEEAVLGYLAGLRDSDFGQVKDAFWDKNEVKRIYGQYKVLCGIDRIPVKAFGGQMENGSQEAGEFLEQVKRHMEEADFDGLEFMGFVPVMDLAGNKNMDTESYQQYLETVEDSEGGIELESRAAVIRIDECQYLLFFDLAKKEDQWYIYKPGDVLTGFLNLDTHMTGAIRLDADGESAIEPLLEGKDEKLPETSGKVKTVQERQDGFDSPQAAVKAYLESLKSHDLEQAVNTFYLRTYWEEYSFDAYTQCQLPRLFGWQDIGLPPANDLARAVAGWDQEADLKRDVERQGMIVCLLNQYLENPEKDFEENVFDWEMLGEKLDWGSLEILGSVPKKVFVDLGSTKTSQARFDTEMEKIALGADGLESWAMGYEIGGREYILSMEVIQYGNKWYNKSFGTPVSGEIGVPEELMGMIPAIMLGDWEKFEGQVVDF